MSTQPLHSSSISLNHHPNTEAEALSIQQSTRNDRREEDFCSDPGTCLQTFVEGGIRLRISPGVDDSAEDGGDGWDVVMASFM